MAAPGQRRWLWLGVGLLLAIFLIWFFLLRNTQDQKPGVAGPLPRPALGKTISYEDYISAVRDALSSVRQAESLAGEERKKAIESAVQSLEKVEGALVSGFEVREGASEIDNTLLITELNVPGSDLSRVEQGLSLLDETLRQVPGNVLVGTLDGAQARQELQRVLSDSAFDYERNLSPLQQLARWLGGLAGQADPTDTLWRWLTALIAGIASGTLAYLASDRLGSKWARLGIAMGVGLLVGLLFYTGLGALSTTVQVIGAVGLVLAAVAVGLLVTGVHRASAPAGGARRVSELAAVLGMSASEGRRRAVEAAGAGDFRGAIRYRCLALLLAFDEVGKLHFDRAATNREYLFRAPGDLQEELQPLLDRFDAVWYGGQQADAVAWQAYSSQAASIEARIGEAHTASGRGQARSAA